MQKLQKSTNQPSSTQQYTFVNLTEQQIIDAMQLLEDIQITKEDIRNPTQAFVRQFFSQFLVLLQQKNVYEIIRSNQEKINHYMRASIQETHSNSMPIIILYLQLKKYFDACGVDAFSLADLVSPTKKNFITQISGLYNFIGFQEGQLKNLIEKKLDEIQQVNQKIASNKEFKEQILLIQQDENLRQQVVQPQLHDFKEQLLNGQKKLVQLSSHMKQKEDLIESLNRETNSQQTQLQNLKDSNEQKKSTFDRQQSQVYSEEFKENLQKEIEEFTNKIASLNQDLTDLQKQSKKLESEIMDSQKTQGSMIIYQEEVQKNLRQRDQRQRMQDELQQLNEQLQAFHTEEEEYKTDINTCKNCIAKYKEDQPGNTDKDLQNDINEIIKKRLVVQKQCDELQDQIGHVNDDLSEVVAEMEKYQSSNQRAINRVCEGLNELLKLWIIQIHEIENF